MNNQNLEIQTLIESLRDKKAQETTAKILIQIGEPAVLLLIAALQSTSGNLRRAVAVILAEIGDKRAIEPVALLLRDKNYYIHWAVSEALAKFGKAATDSLHKLLEDSDGQVRYLTAHSLYHIADTSSAEPLLKALDDKDFKVRHYAILALSKIGYVKAIDKLVAILLSNDDKDLELRASVSVSLPYFGETALILLIRLLKTDKLTKPQHLEIIHTLCRFEDEKAIEVIFDDLIENSRSDNSKLDIETTLFFKSLRSSNQRRMAIKYLWKLGEEYELRTLEKLQQEDSAILVREETTRILKQKYPSKVENP